MLLLGPCVGRMSDLLDRRCLMIAYYAFMAVSTILVTVVVAHGSNWQAVFALMLVVSFCNVADQTIRMPFLSDLLANDDRNHLLGEVIAMRAVGYNIARMLGSQLVGLGVQLVGVIATLF